ncbi:MAG: diguanylate cyclase [Pyrinomonadaceae bacterium]
MSKTPDFIDKNAMADLARASGLAVAVIDGPGEIFTANNNSICRTLNPSGKFTGPCSAFCGTALDEVIEVGSRVSFTCHAGLECRVIPIETSEKPLVAIIGRTFTKAENYRKATERAISGDWRDHSPATIFENVLLSGSTTALDKAVEKIERIVSAKPAVTKPVETQPSAAREPKIEKPVVETAAQPVEKAPVAEPEIEKDAITDRAAEARAWRSFFGSILKVDYAQAATSILEFLAYQYDFRSLIWLESSNGTFETAAAFGEMKGRKVRLRLKPDDQRLLEAAGNDMPLVLAEKGDAAKRVMHLFSIGVGEEISAAIAILDEIELDETKRQLVRICQSLAPQLEILRLRTEVARRESLTNAVRAFSTSLKKVDSEDVWLNLTQIAAEMLSAERASLMLYNESDERFDLKAMIGSVADLANDGELGMRVAQIVFERGDAALISDVSKTDLPEMASVRKYKTNSFLSCPIKVGGRCLGVMNFTDRSDGSAFDKSALRLFLAIAPQLAIAIDRAMLRDKAGEFETLSVTDPLTGLLNRRYIEARLLEEVKRSNRHGFPMSFMMLDVDNFKSYNDQFGHPAGDDALRLVGNVIRETLRGADVAARFGGEEFSILLPQTTNEEAVAIAERIRHNIEQTRFEHRVVTSSIGIASCSAELCLSADLVAAADKALYEAKRKGRNRVQSFDSLVSK